MIRHLSFKDSKKYPFCLDKVLYAGQDFRWQPLQYNLNSGMLSGWHSGVLAGNLIHIRQNENVLEYKSHSDSDLDEVLRYYFRLDVDINEIYDEISCRDEKIKMLAKQYPWLRVLRQPDPWECMVAYICSPLSNVPSIRGMVETIAWTLGDPIELDGNIRFTFPTWKTVFCDGVKPLEELRLGLDRDFRIFDAASLIYKRQLDLYKLARRDVLYIEAIEQLEKCDGIKGKISNCVALFALNKAEAFPVDSRVWEAVKGQFPSFQHQRYSKLTEGQKKKIIRWAQCRFGKYAGYANQFLYFA